MVKLLLVLKWFRKRKWLSITAISVLTLIILFTVATKYQNNKEAEALASEEDQKSVENTPDTEFSKEQEKFKEKWGEPKEGFRWTDSGDLQAIGDTDKTAEEVAFIYIRSLSTLDFANAQRYSYKTDVVNTYKKYYNSESEFSYNKGFERDMYKEVLLSMEPLGVDSVASFAEFEEVITMEVELLDLTNKDFWKEESDQLYAELKKYRVTERDTTKMKEFIYNYVLSYYTSKEPKTRTVKIDLMMEETIDGSWLVTNDSDLDGVAQYKDGEVVVNDILMNFEDWLSTEGRDEVQDEAGSNEDSSSEDDSDLLDKDDGVFKNDGSSKSGDELGIEGAPDNDHDF